MDGLSFTHQVELCDKGRASRAIAWIKLEEGCCRGVGVNVVHFMVAISYVIVPEQYNDRIISEKFFLISVGRFCQHA